MTHPLDNKKRLYWVASTNPRDSRTPPLEKDPSETFFGLQYHAPSSLSVVYDNERGHVWLYDKKPNQLDDGVFSARCETSALRPNEAPHDYYQGWREAEGQKIFLSWSSKLDKVHLGNSADNFVIFQWKSYEPKIETDPKSSQYYPFLLRILNNRIQLIHSNFEAGWLVIWQEFITADKWVNFELEILLSRDKSQGKLTLAVDGKRQKFRIDQYGNEKPPENEDSEIFTGRTHDTYGNYPKWGVYRNGHPEFEAKHYVDRLYIKQID